MGWNANKPADTDGVSASVEDIKANWQALEDYIGTEHGSLSADSAGVHYGPMGVLYVGSSEITGDIGHGALRADTASGVFQIYSTATSAWSNVLMGYAAKAFRTHTITGITIQPTTWTPIPFNNVVYDPLGITDDTTIITIPFNGYYRIQANVHWKDDQANYHRVIAITCNINGTWLAYTSKYLKIEDREGNPDYYQYLALNVFDIRYLAAGTTVCVCAYHDHTSSAEIGKYGMLLVERLS